MLDRVDGRLTYLRLSVTTDTEKKVLRGNFKPIEN